MDKKPTKGALNRRAWIAGLGMAVVVGGIGTAFADSSVTAGWPAAKANIYAHQQQVLSQDQAHPRPKLSIASAPPAPQPAPTRHAGILPMHQGPFLPSTYIVRNFWQGPVGSDWVLVYAGAARGSSGGPPPEGALRLYSETSDLHLALIGTFPAATGTGPLTITSASGDVLQLTSDDGATMSFNLRTHTFE